MAACKSSSLSRRRVPIVLVSFNSPCAPGCVGMGARGALAALRTAIVQRCVWSGGAHSFSAGVRGVDVDPIRIGREIASPRTRFVDMARTDLDTARLERVGVWRPRGLRHVSHGGTTVQTAFTTRTAPTRPCRRRVQGSAPRQRASMIWSWGSRPAWTPRL